MPDGLSHNLEGIEELLAKLETVKMEPRRKGARFAMRKAANIVRDAAQARAAQLDDPQSPENIADNIAIQFAARHFRQTGDPMMRVGVRGGAKGHAAAVGELRGRGSGNPGGDTFHWRFLEFGTQNMAARPFMRPAMDESIGPATSAFVTEFDKSLTRAIRRANRSKA